MSIYSFTSSISKHTAFLYGGIFLFFIFFFRDKLIGLNVILALIIATITVWYIHDKTEVSKNIEQKQQEEKLDTIRPVPKEFEGRNDIIDFFFSVQDYYRYNPETYEEVIDNVDAFFKIHNVLFINTEYPDDYYQIADSKKRNALNSFQSLIYSLPDNEFVLEKFNRAHKRLETILNKYLNEMYDQTRDFLIKNGFNIHRRAINLGPKEYNQYFTNSKDFTFQFY